MKLIEIRQESELETLRPQWDDLLGRCRSANPFLTWEWTASWWSAYGTPGELRILALHDSAGSLCAIAALRAQAAKAYGQRVPTLAFTTDGSNDSDYLDFLVAEGYEQQAGRWFTDYLVREMDRGTIVRLNEIPGDSPNLALFKQAAARRFWYETPVPCAVAALPEQWDDYLARLKPRFRTKVRSVLRALESRPDVRFGFAETAADLERLLPALYDLHRRRWEAEGKPGVFGWDRKRDFYEKLSPAFLRRGCLRFSWLEWNGRVLACQYGFAYGDTYFHLQEGYEPASEHWNLGIGLRAWSIRELIHEGIRIYDFLGGVGRHKTDWGADVKHSLRVVAARERWTNFLFCRGPKWEARAREQAAGMLPEAVLAARRSLIGRRAVPAANSRAWLRQAACWYMHLQIPALTRPLRRRYQLTLPPGRPKWRLTRRGQSSGRILYYHRVNDEGDPFLPATPTHVFEHEIRFIAKHYKVVGLAELLRHLESGSPEPVLAVTFDDGYQDNFTNALPVLQRYGIPATIFLTTGSLDSRELLWFEQLATAIRKTEREYLDLEADIPRRFWMRSVAERLRANDQIFSFLRGLSDFERRQRLDGMLRQLGAAAAEQRGRMLEWDQVRAMAAAGITFGGHTVTHPFLSKLAPGELAFEVSECRRRIEEETQRPVRYFAYPNGREPDFDGSSKEALRAAGYEAALSTIWGVNYHSTDRMELRRGQPWEEDAAMFACKFDWYQWVNG